MDGTGLNNNNKIKTEIVSSVPVDTTEGWSVDRSHRESSLQHPALHLLDPFLGLSCVSECFRRPEPLRHGRCPGPQSGCEVDAVDKLVPHASLPADNETFLSVGAVEVERLREVILGPVTAVADVVEVPGTAQDCPQTFPSHLGHLPLPLSLKVNKH